MESPKKWNGLTNTISVAIIIVAIIGCGTSYTDTIPPSVKITNVELKDQIVEASCGECQFGMAGDSCDLAIRLDGKSYFVDGVGLDDHGDAHAADGMCNCCRKAKVSGTIVNGRFSSTKFEVLPLENNVEPIDKGTKGN